MSSRRHSTDLSRLIVWMIEFTHGLTLALICLRWLPPLRRRYCVEAVYNVAELRVFANSCVCVCACNYTSVEIRGLRITVVRFPHFNSLFSNFSMPPTWLRGFTLNSMTSFHLMALHVPRIAVICVICDILIVSVCLRFAKRHDRGLWLIRDKLYFEWIPRNSRRIFLTLMAIATTTTTFDHCVGWNVTH